MAAALSLYLAMFGTSFVVVFLLGLQSRNVNAGRYTAAVVTSAGINASQFLFVKFVSNGGVDVLLFTTLGGCTGIATAIWFYQNIVARKKTAGDLEVDADIQPIREWEPVRIDRMPDMSNVKIVPLSNMVRSDLHNEDLIHAYRREH